MSNDFSPELKPNSFNKLNIPTHLTPLQKHMQLNPLPTKNVKNNDNNLLK